MTVAATIKLVPPDELRETSWWQRYKTGICWSLALHIPLLSVLSLYW